MAKRRTKKQGALSNFDAVPYNHHGRRILIYLCLRCTRAWQMPDPCEAWRIKSLLSHADSHNERVGHALATASDELATKRLEEATA